ncbi:MAG: hypothetical protein F6K48_02860 [Okeania sp. SIO3H1]|nr:hypothetical protein [Okeania sp. SIO3H1]
MSKKVDDSWSSAKHTVERCKNKLFIKDTKTGELLGERRYATDHAAVCALGRCKKDHTFSKTLLTKAKIDALKGTKSKSKHKPAGGMKMEQIAITALEEIAVHMDTDLNTAADVVIDKVKDKLDKKQSFVGAFKLRDSISQYNQDLE